MTQKEKIAKNFCNSPEEITHKQLYRKAQKLDVRGRSGMNKAALLEEVCKRTPEPARSHSKASNSKSDAKGIYYPRSSERKSGFWSKVLVAGAAIALVVLWRKR